MIPTTGGDIVDVVPTPDKDAAMLNNMADPADYTPKTPDQLRKIVAPLVASALQAGRNRIARNPGFTVITGRIDLKPYRSDEVNDVVKIVREIVDGELWQTHMVTFTYYDEVNPDLSDFYHSHADRDLTFSAEPG